MRDRERSELQSLIAKLKRIKKPSWDTIRTIDRLERKYRELYLKPPKLKTAVPRRIDKKPK